MSKTKPKLILGGITLCRGSYCPIRDECKRFVKHPVDFLNPDYFMMPYNKKEMKCAQQIKKRQREKPE